MSGLGHRRTQSCPAIKFRKVLSKEEFEVEATKIVLREKFEDEPGMIYSVIATAKINIKKFLRIVPVT